MTWKIALVFLWLFWGVCLVGAEEPKPIKVVMPNGMTLIVLERTGLPIVSLGTMVKAGSIDDPMNQSGLANITASLLETGTAKRNAVQIADAVDFIGADLSVQAEEDYTTAGIKVLKKEVETGFDLLSDMLMYPVFDPNEISRSKKGIMGEILAQKDDPMTIASRAFYPLIFSGHPYGYPVIGREETLPNITRNDITAFHKNFYRPNNTLLAVVGDITLSEAKKLAKKYFGKWASQKVSLPTFALPEPITQTKTQLIEKDLAQTSVLMGHVGIRRSNPDYYAVVVMNYILGGGGFSSRMMTDIRDNKGLVYSIYSNFDANKESGSFTVSLQTKSADEAIPSVVTAIKKMREEQVSEQELSETQSYLTGSFPLRLDTTDKLVRLLLQLEYHRLGFDYFKRYPEYINRVTWGDVLRVAQKYLHPDRTVFVIVGKKGGGYMEK